MCYFKKYIKNPIKDENLSGFDKFRISVACGKCPECRKLKSRDWQFRSFFEFYNNPHQAFFFTATYEDSYLPRYNGKPCFDSEHIKSFMARLRARVGKVRYFVVSEYGGFTHRPHYHFVLVPEKVFTKNEFYRQTSASWWYGVVNDIELLPSVNQDKLKAISYISEYTTKDINFDVYAYEEDMPDRYISRVRASKNWGSQFLKFCTKDVLKQGFYFLPVGKNGISVRFRIPRYYELKLLYDYSWDKESQKAIMKRNKLGFELAVYRHNANFVSILTDFFQSRLTNLAVYPVVKSKILELGKPWHDLVVECFKDFEEVRQYFYFKDFLQEKNVYLHFQDHPSEYMVYDEVFDDFYYREDFSDINLNPKGIGYYLDTISQSYSYHPSWSFIEKVYNIYELYRSMQNSVKNKIDSERLIESCKARTRKKIRENASLRNWIVKKHIDVSQYYN